MGLLWGVKGIKGQKVEVGGPGGEEENETSVGKKGVSGWRERLEGKTGGRGGASMGHKGGPVGGYWGSKWGSGLQRSGRRAWGIQGTLGVSKWGQQGGGRRKREDGGPWGADRGESEGGDGWRGELWGGTGKETEGMRAGERGGIGREGDRQRTLGVRTGTGGGRKRGEEWERTPRPGAPPGHPLAEAEAALGAPGPPRPAAARPAPRVAW